MQISLNVGCPPPPVFYCLFRPLPCRPCPPSFSSCPVFPPFPARGHGLFRPVFRPLSSSSPSRPAPNPIDFCLSPQIGLAGTLASCRGNNDQVATGIRGWRLWSTKYSDEVNLLVVWNREKRDAFIHRTRTRWEDRTKDNYMYYVKGRKTNNRTLASTLGLSLCCPSAVSLLSLLSRPSFVSPDQALPRGAVLRRSGRKGKSLRVRSTVHQKETNSIFRAASTLSF